MIRMITTTLCCAALLAAPAAAQEQREAPIRSEAWYGEQLSELAEVLGGAHYLRILCQGRGDQRWRDYMRGVIAREPSYNDALVEGFNRGYRQEEARFSTCDRAASQMEAELRARGLRVAGGLSARHGD
ncbi:MAG: TIGR02301 family protein [Hyphomonadaceae bacterium]